MSEAYRGAIALKMQAEFFAALASELETNHGIRKPWHPISENLDWISDRFITAMKDLEPHKGKPDFKATTRRIMTACFTDALTVCAGRVMTQDGESNRLH